MLNRRTLLAASAATLAAPAVLRAQTAKAITFYYPIAVGGPLAAVIDGYCRDFAKQSGITVTPVYAGSYVETVAKAVTAIKAGEGPHIAVQLATELHSLVDMDILVSLEELGLDADGQKWIDGFYPAFLANSRKLGHTWSVPFQRSTAIDFYNKDAFAKAGLDPEAFPTTWDGLVNAGKKLVQRDATGRTTRWGFKLASDAGNAQWTFGALANQAGHVLMNQAGTEVYFNDPKAIEAMAFWRSLAFDDKITPTGITNWGTLPSDFLEGNAAIIQSTTGNLTNLRDKATFKFGVGGLPGKTGVRTVVGGGNLYFFKHADAAQRAAALAFARFLTTPERAADWCMQTGYIATRPDAWETPALKAYVAKYPDANVARTYLPVATGELSTFENQRVQTALLNNIQACLSGGKTPAQAMADAQSEADRILKPYKKA
jgi:sn-glycerol 3-phosphate transport system substrate-binding protein